MVLLVCVLSAMIQNTEGSSLIKSLEKRKALDTELVFLFELEILFSNLNNLTCLTLNFKLTNK